MALVIKDRVKETTTTTGTGTLTLAGATTGYQSFGTAIGNTNTTYYTISTPTGSEWEVGLGTVGAGTLARTTILASSNGGSAVNFSAGVKDVFGTYPAGKAIYQSTDIGNDVTINTLRVGLGGGAVATNTAVGFQAINATATGTNNVALGYQALNANTSANQNTAVGYASLQNNTTGSNNTGLGTSSLNANTATVATLGAITAGSGYTNGTYRNVQSSLSSGSAAGTYPLLDVTVSGGAVTAVTLKTGGTRFINTTTVLTVSNTLIGGTGSGFTIPVATLATGGNNTALGYQSLFSNTTASNNTGIGYQAGYYTNTGASNVSVGYQALFQNTTGTQNVAIGLQTLAASTSGVNAFTAVLTAGSGYVDATYNGVQLTYSSGTAVNSGGTYPTANIVVSGGAVTTVTLVTRGTRFQDTSTIMSAAAASLGGSGSGFTIGVSTLTGGSYNTAVGYQALNKSTTSSTNTAVGYTTLNNLTTGDACTAIGFSALNATTTGSNNVGIGYEAGAAITTGTQNTLLGMAAGKSGTNNLTTGSNNIIIGYNAAASSATVSNEITLGNSSITSLRLAPLITGYTSAAPTIASAATIAPTKPISFVSGTTTIDTITAPAPLTGGGGSITLIPTGLWSTSTAGNIALATTAVVSRALILTWDNTTAKWYPSY